MTSEAFNPAGDPRYFHVPYRGHMAPLAKHSLSRYVKDDSACFRRSLMVGQRMRELLVERGERSPAVLDAFQSMGILHDVGYGFQLSAMHAFDGATLLEDDVLWRWLAPHVAWHGAASYEYDERHLRPRHPKPPAFDHATLWVADMTVNARGERVSPQERFDELLASPNRFERNATLRSLDQLNRAIALYGKSPVSIP